MSSRPDFFAQETEYSCAVACLRMVLSAYGIERTEEELRVLCDCGLEGTEALKLVDAARQLGLIGTRKYNLNLGELIAEVAPGRCPIVYVRTRFGGSTFPTQHAYVVIKVNQQEVTVLDPLSGERIMPTVEFEHEWRQMRGLTILCQK